MAELSPVSQAVLAVLDALHEASWDWSSNEQASPRDIAATALRVAARQLREAYANEQYLDHPDDWLFDIAAELESGNEPTFTPKEIEMIQAPWSYLQSQQEIENE